MFARTRNEELIQAQEDRRQLAKELRDERDLSSKLLEALVECNRKLGEAQAEIVYLRESVSQLDYDLWVLTSPELSQL